MDGGSIVWNARLRGFANESNTELRIGPGDQGTAGNIADSAQFDWNDAAAYEFTLLYDGARGEQLAAAAP